MQLIYVPVHSHSFPTRRSSDLIVRLLLEGGADTVTPDVYGRTALHLVLDNERAEIPKLLLDFTLRLLRRKCLSIEDMHKQTDRKSTRLNSSHTVISYAVFCLKK